MLRECLGVFGGVEGVFGSVEEVIGGIWMCLEETGGVEGCSSRFYFNLRLCERVRWDFVD